LAYTCIQWGWWLRTTPVVSPQTLVLPVLTPSSLWGATVSLGRAAWRPHSAWPASPQQFGQLGEVYRQLPRLVFGKQISRWTPTAFIFELEIGEQW
jgi:hypothetical protein